MDDARILVDPAICAGKPVIRGTRIMVRNVLGMVAGRYTVDRIIECYPELTEADVRAALVYTARMLEDVNVLVTA